MLMTLMSKSEYLIDLKGTKYTGSGKLGLNAIPQFTQKFCIHISIGDEGTPSLQHSIL